MTSARKYGLGFLLLGGAVLVSLGSYFAHLAPGAVDFKESYYGGRCLLQHCDPYNQSDLERVYLNEAKNLPTEPVEFRRVVTVSVYPPTTFTFFVPLSLLPWGLAQILWRILTAGLLVLAAYLTWDLTACFAPKVSGALLGLLLATSVWPLITGNPGGVVVGLAVIAVWCFLRDRFVPVGVLCLAASLILKPHAVGFVWLYFLLAGGRHRKRALRTLVAAIVLGLPGLLIVGHSCPHWMAELHSNLSELTTRGNINDPGPSSPTGRDPDGAIGMQTIVSVFRDEPSVYNPISYLASGTLVLLWLLAVLKSRSSPGRDRLALAVIAAFSLLLGYHRQHDAKILMLTFPAFAMLWAEGGSISWVALVLTAAAVVSIGDITSFLRIYLTKDLLSHTTGVAGEVLTVLLARPVPLILITTGIFYLWVYVRRVPAAPARIEVEPSAQVPVEPSFLELGPSGPAMLSHE